MGFNHPWPHPEPTLSADAILRGAVSLDRQMAGKKSDPNNSSCHFPKKKKNEVGPFSRKKHSDVGPFSRKKSQRNWS